LSRPEAAASALAAVASIPRDGDGPVFPAPWAANAFAMTLMLHENGVFTWPQWAERLGAAISAQSGDDTDPETYWRCWLSALETTIAETGLAGDVELENLREAWREAAARTPHGEPITLGEKVKAAISR
jgi:nitrile hydratase accessory protein